MTTMKMLLPLFQTGPVNPRVQRLGRQAVWAAITAQQTSARTSPGYAKQQLPTAAIKKRYGVIRSIIDTVRALRQNPKNYGLAVLAVLGASTLIIIPLLIVMNKLNLGVALIFAILLGSTGVSMVGLLIAATVYILLTSAVSAGLLAVTAIAINDGVNYKRSTEQLLQATWHHAPRVFKAMLLTIAVIYWPILLATLILLFFRDPSDPFATVALAAVATLIAILVSVISALRYTLTPYVALFEPSTPLGHTLSRSKFLLQKGGQWFILKAVVGLALISALLTGMLGRDFTNSAIFTNPWLSNISSLLFTILCVGALTMFYLNRRHVRDADQSHQR